MLLVRLPVLLPVLLPALAACRPRKEPTPEEACLRIEPFRSPLVDGGWTDREREGCAAQWRSLEADSRLCARRCIESSKTPRDYDECLEECAGNQLSPLGICAVAAPDGSSADSDCIARLSEVKDRRPAAYSCVNRCARRSKSPEEASTCEPSCGLR